MELVFGEQDPVLNRKQHREWELAAIEQMKKAIEQINSLADEISSSCNSVATGSSSTRPRENDR